MEKHRFLYSQIGSLTWSYAKIDTFSVYYRKSFKCVRVLLLEQVSCQLSFGEQASQTLKMVAATSPHSDTDIDSDTDSIADPLPSSQDACGILSTPVSNHLSPAASTESLLGRTMEELLGTPAIISPVGFATPLQAFTLTPGHRPDIFHILTEFSEMLANGLAQTAAQITNTIKADLQNLGSHIEAIEQTGLNGCTGKSKQNVYRPYRVN